MALEMKVFAEIANFEAKPMFGVSWRQLGALAFMTFIGGGVFAGVTYLRVVTLGEELGDATSVAMWFMWPVNIPAAAYGWWRPKGLKPERFLGFWFRHMVYVVNKRSVRYADTYQPGESVSRPRAGSGRGRVSRKFKREVREHS